MRRTSFIVAGIAIALIFSTSAFASEKGGLPALDAAVQNLRRDVEVLKTAPPDTGVGFTFNDDRVSIIPNTLATKLVEFTIDAPYSGYIVLTGSGIIGTGDENIPIGGVATIALVKEGISYIAHTEIGFPETTYGGYHPTIHPFSMTTVIHVEKGPHKFYMDCYVNSWVGAGTLWYGEQLKLTAIFVRKWIKIDD